MDHYEIAEQVRLVLEDREDSLLRQILHYLKRVAVASQLTHQKEPFAMGQLTVKNNQFYTIKFSPGVDDAGVQGTLPADLTPVVTDNPADFSITPNPEAAGEWFVKRTGHANAAADGSEVATIGGSSASDPNFQVSPMQLLFVPDAATSASVEGVGDPQELPEPGPAASIVISGISATASVGGAAEQGVATVVDANNVPVDPQPAVTWGGTINSGGSISDTGLYTPGQTAATDTVTAEADNLPPASIDIVVS